MSNSDVVCAKMHSHSRTSKKIDRRHSMREYSESVLWTLSGFHLLHKCFIMLSHSRDNAFTILEDMARLLLVLVVICVRNNARVVKQYTTRRAALIGEAYIDILTYERVNAIEFRRPLNTISFYLSSGLCGKHAIHVLK